VHQVLKGAVVREDQEHPRDARPAGANQGRHRGAGRLAERAEVAGEHIDEHGERVARHQHPQAVRPVADHLGRVVEQSEQPVCEDEQQRPAGRREHIVQHQRDAQRFAAALQLSRAVVLPHHRGAGLGKGVAEVIREDLQIVRRAGRRDDRGAEAVDRRLHADVRQREHHALQSRRDADAQDIAQHGAVHAQLPRHDPQLRLAPAEQDEQRSGAEEVCEHGRRGDAARAHAEHEHKHEVERHVGGAGDRQHDQRRRGVASRAVDRRFEIIEEDHRQAEEVEPQVLQRHAPHLLRHGEKRQEPGRAQLSRRGEDHAAEQRKQDGGVDRPAHPVAVALPDHLRQHDVRAQREAGEQVHDQRDHRCVAAHRRHGVLADEAAHDRDIRRVEQLLQHGGQRQRQRDPYQFIADRAVQQVELAPLRHVPIAFRRLRSECVNHTAFAAKMQVLRESAAGRIENLSDAIDDLNSRSVDFSGCV